MSFNTVEQKLKKFFGQTNRKVDVIQKARVKENVLAAFRIEQQKKHSRLFFLRLFQKNKKVFAFSFMLFLLIFNFLPNGNKSLYAGKLYPKKGVVEIIRNGKTILVEDETDILIDDYVRIGNKSEADILLPDKLLATAQNKTYVKVTDDKNLFLEEGSLSGQSLNDELLLTENGQVSGNKGSDFDISVSQSGETHIVNKQDKIKVFDKSGGLLELNQGEEIKLRQDTVLTDHKIPDDLKLSLEQETAIESKLVIVRTKVARGLEKMLSWQFDDASKDFVSAEKSFRSIVQIGNSTRNLEIIKRINIDLVNNDDVYLLLSQKTDNAQLLEEVKATQEIFNLLKNYKQYFSLPSAKTGLSSFDNYMIFDKLFSFGDSKQKSLGVVIKRQYVVEFLQQIQNESLLVDQMSVMRDGLEKLPHNDLQKEFEQELKSMLSPYLLRALENINS